MRPVSSLLVLLAALCAVCPAQSVSPSPSSRVERRIARIVLEERRAPRHERLTAAPPPGSFAVALQGEHPRTRANQPAEAPLFNRPPPAR